jgi:3-oxoacyl-[acyl-carrier-protein] synthase II
VLNRRVVVTGIGAITAIGSSWTEAQPRLESGRNAVVYMDSWDYEGLYTRLAAPVIDFPGLPHLSRKRTRTMGRVSLMAVAATEQALRQAGLDGAEFLGSGSVGVAYGSSTGSTDAAMDFIRMLLDRKVDGITATTYIRMMSHTAPVNIAVHFGLTGRVITSSSACTSGSQAIGYAYETIRSGRQLAMIAGGGEELCPTEAAVFDTLYATSTRNEAPETTPRPFDKDRDGLVIGEGACTFLLEDLDHAKARGADILAEVIGFGTNCDGAHVTRPNRMTMGRCMELALADAGLPPTAIGYVNAHGTATEHGDIAESHATSELFGANIPISSLKSYLGHSLGACGAIEAWLTIEMMNHGWFAQTANLENVDPRCGELDYIQGQGRRITTDCVMSNNFAFGGINTSLVLRRYPT